STSCVIRSTALELVVHTQFDHLGIAAPVHGGDGGCSPVSQLEIVVFELDGPVGFEPVFDASPQKPATVGIWTSPDRYSAREGKRRIILSPAAADLAVSQPPAGYNSKTCGDSADPFLPVGKLNRP